MKFWVAIVLAVMACSGCDPSGTCGGGERCGVAPLLVSLVDGNTGELLPAGTVDTVPPGAMVQMGCVYSGERWGCSHEVLTIPGNDDVRVHSDEPRPGYGEFEPNVELHVEISAGEARYETRVVDVSLNTTDCGSVHPKHVEIGLIPLEQDVDPPAVDELAAPESCGG